MFITSTQFQKISRSNRHPNIAHSGFVYLFVFNECFIPFMKIGSIQYFKQQLQNRLHDSRHLIVNVHSFYIFKFDIYGFCSFSFLNFHSKSK